MWATHYDMINSRLTLWCMLFKELQNSCQPPWSRRVDLFQRGTKASIWISLAFVPPWNKRFLPADRYSSNLFAGESTFVSSSLGFQYSLRHVSRSPSTDNWRYNKIKSEVRYIEAEKTESLPSLRGSLSALSNQEIQLCLVFNYRSHSRFLGKPVEATVYCENFQWWARAMELIND